MPHFSQEDINSIPGMKPKDSMIISMVVGTFLAGLLVYAVWVPVARSLDLPDWLFFVCYSLVVPVIGFYRALTWGYWLAKIEYDKREKEDVS